MVSSKIVLNSTIVVIFDLILFLFSSHDVCVNELKKKKTFCYENSVTDDRVEHLWLNMIFVIST